MSTGASVVDIWRVWQDWRAYIPSNRLVDFGLSGGGRGGGGVGIKTRIVENFAQTGDATVPTMSTPMSNMCGAEGWS